MTGKETEQNMLRAASDMRESVNSSLNLLDKKQTTAIKAYKISLGMIDQAARLVEMKFSDEAHDEKYYSVREDRIFKNPGTAYFSDKKEWYYSEKDIDTKQSFLVYAHAVQMVRSAFLDKENEKLQRAQRANDAEAVFEIRMIVDTLNTLLDEWKKQRQAEGGIF